MPTRKQASPNLSKSMKIRVKPGIDGEIGINFIRTLENRTKVRTSQITGPK